MDAHPERVDADPKKVEADPKRSQAMCCFRRFLEAPWDSSGGPLCVFWSKVRSKRMLKECPKGVKRKPKNRTPDKYGKCGFDIVFIRFWPCRHSQTHNFLHTLGYQSGAQTQVHKKTASEADFGRLRCDSRATSGDPHYSRKEMGGGTECLFGGPGEDNRRGA